MRACVRACVCVLNNESEFTVSVHNILGRLMFEEDWEEMKLIELGR